MDSQKKKITIIISSIAIFLLMVAAIALFWIFSKKSKEPFNFEQAFSNINVKSMIVNELDKQLSSKLDDYKLTLEEKDGKTEELAGESFALKYYLSDETKNLDNIDDPNLWIFSILNPKDSEEGAGISFNEDLLRNNIDNLACFQDVVEPKNPSIEYTDGSYVIVDGVIGNKVDSNLLYDSIVNAFTQGETKINLESLGCYIVPKYTSDSQEVINALNELNTYSKRSVTYTVGNNQEYLDSATINSWLRVDEDFNVTFNYDNVYGFVNSLASKYNTVGKTRNFPSSSGGTVQVSGGVYGWKVNTSGEVESLISAIKNGTSSKELTFSQKGAVLGDNDIGNSYVEIDLGRQHLWLYIDGALIMDTNVISGNVSKNYTTPAGVYSLYYKQKDQILRGADYATPVAFWMPFNGGIGLHDASWRTAEELANPQTYLTAGSHGCVNMTYEAAQTIYNNVWAGIPIVCYY
ncbi:MAG: peptidoglycan binding domain-containing protein [Clostridium sp.]|nr:peptidoglycan binding domain-containing protein [Clostridium sp.]